MTTGKRVTATNVAPCCENCGRELGAGETVFVWRRQGRSMIGTGWPMARGCEECAEDAYHRDQQGRQISIRAILRRGAQPSIRTTECYGCERPIAVITDTRYAGPYTRRIYCSSACREAESTARRERDAIGGREKVCEACGEYFGGTRSDAKTCSLACRQKMHRERRKKETA